MQSPIQKLQYTLLIVILMIILPLGTFFIYSFSNMRENEKAMQEIYNEQLESVLFSVNQYTNDFLNSSLTKISNDLTDQSDSLSQESLFYMENKGFTVFKIYPVDLGEPIVQAEFDEQPGKLSEILDQILLENQEVITRLVDYKSTGYTKLEPIDLVNTDSGIFQSLFAVISVDNTNFIFAGLIDPEVFAREVLSPKMQEIAEEQMVIALSRKESDEIVFSTDTLADNPMVVREMWLFPELNVAIAPKGLTLQKLAKERITYNLIAMGILAVLTITGLIILIRNIRREIQLAQTKSDFVSNVSHELRTPLALISMFSETLMLGRVKDDAKKKEYIEVIHKETNRLTNIVNRILNFSKIEANKRTYNIGNVELNSLVEEICADYSFHFEQNGFDCKLTIDTSKEIWIKGDREAIYEAVVNLIDNAIKYSPEDKRILISAGKSTKISWIEVKDFGAGIAPDKLKQIFDKFYRVTEGDIYNTQGAGLGLTILKHIMDAHDGKVEVDSVPGKGSSFKLIFNNKQV